MTQNTNDLTLGFARARRDLGCTYSLGFYDRNADVGFRRRVVIDVARPGLRVAHPETYEFRSAGEKRTSALSAAFLAPEMYQTGVARAHVFPLRPASPKLWTGLLAVSFPVFSDAAEAGESVRDFGGVLRRGTDRVVYRFDRRVTLRPTTGGLAEERYLTFLEPVELKPGAYRLTLVMSDPREFTPHSAVVELDVPPVPRGAVSLAGPILGREAGRDVVVTGIGHRSRKKNRRDPVSNPSSLDLVGDARSFAPLLVQQVDPTVSVLAMTQACLVGSARADRDAMIVRSIRRNDTPLDASLADVPIALERAAPRVHCQNLVDVLPGGALDPGRYVFEASYVPATSKDAVSREARFAILEGEE